MKLIRSAGVLVALVTAACSGGTVPPSAAPSSPPTAMASPTLAPTAAASVSGADVLTGTWAVSGTTCAQQQAAVEAAGFTAEQLTSVGWSPECPGGNTIRFANGRLVEFSPDGAMGWEGKLRIVDEDTFEAVDSDCSITYDYAIDGDQLTIDMVEDVCPAYSEAELLGEKVVQTEIYETSPFTRQH
jgi:hypothetical protein